MAAAEGAVGALRHTVSPSNHSAGPATCQLTSERGGRSLEDEHSAIKHISVAGDRKKTGGEKIKVGSEWPRTVLTLRCSAGGSVCGGVGGGDYLGANSGLCC